MHNFGIAKIAKRLMNNLVDALSEEFGKKDTPLYI